MKKLLYTASLSLFIQFVPSIMHSQVTVTPITPANAVNNVLVSGGLSISNITSQGNADQFGEFFAPNTNLNMPHGVVLSTGRLTPSNVLATGALVGAGTSGYPALGSNTNNAAVLQFDFVPTGDTLKFEYIFASMEYTSYTCSNFNDVFAFFITGPNPLGGNYNNQNIALIPGTNTPVSINTVNCGQPSSIFDNNCTPAGLSNSQYFVQSCPATASQNQGVGFNGFTVPLTAIAPVMPCSTYTLTMAVADVMDGSFNSAVFLKANSFSGGSVTISPNYNYTNATNDTLIYEGCSDVTINFEKTGISGAYDTVNVQISGTATNGVDYTVNGAPFPSQIIFAPGQMSYPLTLIPVSDGIVEGPETVTLKVTNITLCGDTFVSEVTFVITDVLPMSIDAGPDRIVCPGIPQTITPTVTGGVPPYAQTYWYINSPGNIIGTALNNYVPQTSGMYIYTATSGCDPNMVAYDTVMITISPPQFSLSFDVDSVSCYGTNDGSIDMTVTGQTPPFTYQWTPGNITTEDLNNLGAGTFNVTVTDAFGCQVTGSATVFEPTQIPINITDKFVCSGAEINIGNSPINGVNYTWSPAEYFSNPNSSTPTFIGSNPGPGLDTVTVVVTVTSPGACGQDDFKVYVTPAPAVELVLPGFDTIALCPGDTITLSNGANVTGFPPVTTTSWSTGSSSSQINVTTPGTYWIEQTNNAGCKSRDSVRVEPLSAPYLYADSVRYICGIQSVTLSVLGAEPGDTYLWSSGATTDSITVNTSGIYTVIVTNQCGSDTAGTEVIQVPTVTPEAMPNIFTPNGDGVNDIYTTQDMFSNSQIFNVQVFNRWGTKIYESDDKAINWKPKNISDGVYFMSIIYTDCNNEQQKLAHTITVTSGH